jgi:membrane-associated protease RseP (regulator of RpoE activity)
MVNFIVIDLFLLVAFTIWVIWFIKTRKHNLHKEGWVYLYKTQLGQKSIEWTAKKFKKQLKPMQYLVILSGFILMILMVWLLILTIFIYFQQPDDSPVARIPAVFPLIPYFPQLFGLESVFPPFFFVSFMISIAIVAISHEFAHGIFSRLNNIKILSTGFAFLGPFLGAFVEQDDKQMVRASKFKQMAILAAGTFANVVMMVLFGIILVLFFMAAFTPAGFVFSTYATAPISLSQVDTVNGIPTNQVDHSLLVNEDFLQLKINDTSYFATPAFYKLAKDNEVSRVLVFSDSPALNARLDQTILEFDFTQITSQEELSHAIEHHNPGDTVQVKTLSVAGEVTEHQVTLADNGEGQAFLGVGTFPRQGRGFLSKIYTFFTQVRDPNTYYESKIGSSGQFIYDIIWWIVIINLLVALFNMYPAGILDGGRFLMLAVWGATGSKKFGEYSLKVGTWLLLLAVAAMMTRWVFAFI